MTSREGVHPPMGEERERKKIEDIKFNPDVFFLLIGWLILMAILSIFTAWGN